MLAGFLLILMNQYLFLTTVVAEDTEDLVLLTPENYEDFIQSKIVRPVYFSKNLDLPKYKTFLKQYDKGARVLQSYNVQMGLVNCAEEANHQMTYCKKDKHERVVYVFRNGKEMIELELDTMFDVNSIVSNILQLVLIQEVPIVQSLVERKQIEKASIGNTDFVFAYNKAIGTYEHRVFMEIAYTFQSHFKFALTTSLDTARDLGLDEKAKAGIWILSCKDQTDSCIPSTYTDKFDLSSLAKFLRSSYLPLTYEVTEKTTLEGNPFDASSIHIAYLVYRKDSKDSSLEILNEIATIYRGSFGFLHMNLDTMDEFMASTINLMFPDAITNNNLPLFALKLINEEVPIPMDSAFNMENIHGFISVSLTGYVEKLEQETPTKEESPDDEEGEEVVEKDDDVISDTVFKLRKKPINMTVIPGLTDKTFPAETSTRDLLFVLFYLDVNAKSMAFLRAYTDAGQLLDDKPSDTLARVNCYDWTDVCAKENILIYPTLRIFRKGQKAVDYQGTLDTQEVIKSVKLYRHSGIVRLQSAEEADSFAKGLLPEDTFAASYCSVLGLFSTSESEAFKEAANEFSGKFVFAVATGNLANQLAKKYTSKVPGVVTIKRSDAFEADTALDGDMTKENIAKLIQNSCTPVLPEITPTNYMAYLTKNTPIMLLFGEDPGVGGLTTALGQLAVDPSYRNTITFGTMDVLGTSAIGLKILSSYTTEPTIPSLVFIDHSKGNVFIYAKKSPGDAVTKSDLITWLQKIGNGAIEPSSKLIDREWKPLKEGFDFLKLIDEEKNRPKDNDEDLEELEAQANSEKEKQGESESDRDEEAEAEARKDLLELRNTRLFKDKRRHMKHTQGHETPRDEL